MESIFSISTHPAFLVSAIIIAAWIWEDGSLVTGAILAADGKLSVPLAVSAVFIGIISGDLALYYLGRLAHRWRKLRAWILMTPSSRKLSRRFRQHTLTNIILIRFVPGLRTAGFTLCGLWNVSLRRFLIAMTVAGVIWIAIIFTIVYYLGTSEWLHNSYWKWSLVGIALILLIFNNFWVYRQKGLRNK